MTSPDPFWAHCVYGR